MAGGGTLDCLVWFCSRSDLMLRVSVCLSVQSYEATAFGPRSAKATGTNCAGKATTQQETFYDLS